jgi:hypothetical protein
MDSLERIRSLYTKPSTPFCPTCSHSLTVEKTKYFETHICENCFMYARVISHDPNCCIEPKLQPVKFIISNGGAQVREQCINCGCLKGSSLGGYSLQQKGLLPLADLSRRDIYQSVINEAWKGLSEKKSVGFKNLQERRKDEWFKEYSVYLQSPEWRNKRELVLRRDNRVCQCCLVNHATQVHHKSYEFVDLSGSEPCFDLVSICKSCHDRIEEMKKAKRSNL